MAEHEPNIGLSDDWHTPPKIFTALSLRFDLDPCAPIDRTHYFVPADKIYTRLDNGLCQPWVGRVFMNPPFGGRRGHVPWLRKFFAHGDGIAICRAYTSSDWWHEVVVPNAETMCFPRGKTKFVRPNGVIGSAPGHGVALLGMGQICNDALRDCELGWFVDLRHASTKAARDGATHARTVSLSDFEGPDYPINDPPPPEYEELSDADGEY